MGTLLRKLGQVCAVVGSQWGDEGKGKLVDILAREYDIIVRSTGGANAGHTIYVKKEKYVFHLIPSGIFHSGKICLMGNGMVIHFPTLFEEMEALRKLGVKTQGRLFLSPRAHITFEYHKQIDRLQEEMKGGKKVGTTLRGIGPTYADKISRAGIRVVELENFKMFEEHYRANAGLFEKMYGAKFDTKTELQFFRSNAKKILGMVKDTGFFLDESYQKGKKILIEGANGTLLDIDHGTYPFVTSSNASMSGVISGCGLAPSRIDGVVGILKAYVTRVGSGPFPTELFDGLGEQIRKSGNEYGSTTGRPRRCGWFDTVVARYAAMINGFTAFNLTKLDVLTGIQKLKIATSYSYKGKKLDAIPASLDVLENVKVNFLEIPGWSEDIGKTRKFSDLPKNAQSYVKTIEKLTNIPIRFIGVGYYPEQMVYRF